MFARHSVRNAHAQTKVLQRAHHGTAMAQYTTHTPYCISYLRLPTTYPPPPPCMCPMVTTVGINKQWTERAIIIHSHARVGTGLHCTDLVSAHCPALRTGNLYESLISSKPPTCQGLSDLHTTCPLTGLQLYPYLQYYFLACTPRSLSHIPCFCGAKKGCWYSLL